MAGHDHTGDESPHKGRNLLIALALNVTLAVAEVVGSVVSGSLALLGDAVQNGSDALSILISYVAFRISRRQADRRFTFGYRRAVTVGAMINLTTLFVIALFLAYKPVDRLLAPQEVDATIMLVLGVIALAEDGLSAWILSGNRGLNVRSAFLHMFAGTLATVGVILGAVAIMYWGIRWIGPALTGVIALYLFVHAFLEIRKAIAVLMDTAPRGFDEGALVLEIMRKPGVEDIHRLHLWRPTEQRLALEPHVAVSLDGMQEATMLKRRLEERFGIGHATLELEFGAAVAHGCGLLREGNDGPVSGPARRAICPGGDAAEVPDADDPVRGLRGARRGRGRAGGRCRGRAGAGGGGLRGLPRHRAGGRDDRDADDAALGARRGPDLRGHREHGGRDRGGAGRLAVEQPSDHAGFRAGAGGDPRRGGLHPEPAPRGGLRVAPSRRRGEGSGPGPRSPAARRRRRR